jgi:two-component system sensor histidine kinase PilS (NtrC family)
MDPQARLKHRIILYILVRVVLATLFLGIAALLLYGGQWDLIERERYFYLVAAIFFVMGVSAAGLPAVRDMRRFAYVQLLADTIIITAMVWQTDGVQSVFGVLYFMTIVASAYLVYRKGAIITAAVNAICFSIIGFVEIASIMETTSDRTLITPLYAEILVKVFGFFLVAVLAGELAEQLRKTGVRLAEEEAQVRALEQELSDVVQSLSMGLAILGRNGRLRSANRPALAFFPALKTEKVEDVIPQFSSEGDVWEVEIEREDESPQVIFVSRSNLEDGGAVLTMEDVTSLREIEERVRREERFSAVGHLAAAIAHEVRNPLASLSGAVQLLKVDESEKDLMKIVQREISRINEMVTRFLQSTRRTDFHAVPTDLEELVKEVVETFSKDQQYTDLVQVQVMFQSLSPIPLDRERVRQILWNLLLNAAQSMPEGGAIRISGEQVGLRARLMVSDDGVGVDAKDLSRLFDPFYTTKVGGTGLGLATVERCAREHGGEVWVRSELGKGTTFAVWLPLTRKASARRRGLAGT